MRFNEAVCNPVPPMHIGLQNNNQLQRSSSEIIINAKADSLTEDQANQEFRIGQDTSTYSSLAVTRSNKILEHNININNNLDNNTYQSSSTESLADYEGYYEDPQDLTGSDWSEYSEDGNLPAGCRGIVNPNYPGFQHLGPSLLSDTDDTEDEHELEEDDEDGEEAVVGDASEEDEEEEEVAHEDEFNNNNNNNIVDEAVNRFDAQRDEQKQLFYEKPKFNIQSVSSLIESMNSSATSEIFEAEVEVVQLTTSVKESLQFPEIEEIPDSSKSSEAEELQLEESTVEDPLDLIREANALNQPPIRQHQQQQQQLLAPSTNLIIINGDNNNDRDNPTNNNAEHKSSPNLAEPASPQAGKLEEIDLLASINHRNRGGDSSCREHQQHHHHHHHQHQQASVPDVVANMDHDVLLLDQQQRRTAADTNKLINSELSESATGGSVYVDAKKKEKMMRNQARRRGQQSLGSAQRSRQEAKRRTELESGSFDVYNIETAMPKIDMDAIETHLKAAREEERRRRNDREEIRRRLAMGPDADDVRSERGRKPSLQSRLQSGMNLQICFMNETSSDTESVQGQDVGDASPGSPLSPGSPSVTSSSSTSASSSSASSIATSPSKLAAAARPHVLSLPPLRLDAAFAGDRQAATAAPLDEADFFARQARLQTEARMALAQAKEMAHMQMEVERQKLKQNPITEMVRASLQKIGVTLGEDRRRLTRALLTELNIAQLQVLANDLHARIATLNEALVEGLLRRDDLHMEQDSMLVDVEDLTRYLGAKQESFKKRQQSNGGNGCIVPTTSRLHSRVRQQQQVERQQHEHQDQQQQQERQTSRARTLALLSRASSTRLAAGRQLVVNLVRK